MKENDFLASLRRIFAPRDASVEVGVGPDDCALLRLDGNRLAATTDAFVEGTHFLATDPPEAVAAKAVGATLSDLAASGCRARWLLAAACLRRGLESDWAGRFARSLAAVAARYGVDVVGGDTTASPSGTSISLTALGEPLPGGPLTRNMARPGDAIVVTGSLGGSILGRHLAPAPRFAEMRMYMEYCLEAFPGRRSMGAAMDISDGLAVDLSRLCAESGTGAVVEAGAVPVSRDAEILALRDGMTPLRHALIDGEDFELLLTMAPHVWAGFEASLASSDSGLEPFSRIGSITAGGGMRLLVGETETQLTAEGYEHTW